MQIPEIPLSFVSVLVLSLIAVSLASQRDRCLCAVGVGRALLYPVKVGILGEEKGIFDVLQDEP